jgi:hypothetical protein
VHTFALHWLPIAHDTSAMSEKSWSVNFSGKKITRQRRRTTKTVAQKHMIP